VVFQRLQGCCRWRAAGAARCFVNQNHERPTSRAGHPVAAGGRGGRLARRYVPKKGREVPETHQQFPSLSSLGRDTTLRTLAARSRSHSTPARLLSRDGRRRRRRHHALRRRAGGPRLLRAGCVLLLLLQG